MENKYYTPKIEEFHIGFEFQKLQIVSKGSFLEEDWVENVCDSYDLSIVLDDYSDLKGVYDKDDYRVKYLDKEDIESLGWKFISEPYEKYFKLNENYSLYLEPEDKKNVRIIYTNDWGDISHPIFSGTIKNKSELKKLIQMLNIE